jgi:xanthine/uracil/vitamin C permease (AzgA family)
MIIGLVNAGVVVQGPGNPPLGLTADFTTLRMLTFAIGLALCSILVVRKMRGASSSGSWPPTVIAAIVDGIWGDNVIWDAVGPGIAQGARFGHGHARLQPPRGLRWGSSRPWGSGRRSCRSSP